MLCSRSLCYSLINFAILVGLTLSIEVLFAAPFGSDHMNEGMEPLPNQHEEASEESEEDEPCRLVPRVIKLDKYYNDGSVLPEEIDIKRAKGQCNHDHIPTNYHPHHINSDVPTYYRLLVDRRERHKLRCVPIEFEDVELSLFHSYVPVPVTLKQARATKAGCR